MGDNTGHNISTINCKNTHHGLGSIVFANGSFSSEFKQRKAVPTNKKQSWSIVDFNEGIQIREYIAPDKPALKLCGGQLTRNNFKTIFQTLYGTVSQTVFKLDWLHGHKIYQSNTRKILCHNATNYQLNWYRHDSSSLWLCFVAESCANINLPTPTVTFDQLLHVKAYEIVSTKNMNIFIRVGGFHQLMSFLGSIGCLMECSGLRTAVKCEYV